jgi:hypothetical protein
MNSMWSLGAHYEHLLTTRDSSAPGAAQGLLSLDWSVRRNEVAGQHGFPVHGGKDLTDNQDFYKLKFTKTF